MHKLLQKELIYHMTEMNTTHRREEERCKFIYLIQKAIILLIGNRKLSLFERKYVCYSIHSL